MSNIRIVKLKVRRGVDSERKKIILEEGELGFTTDTKRLFVGDGSLSGGHIVGSRSHDIVNISNNRKFINTAYPGDIVYENNFLYQLTGTDYSQLSGWVFIGTRVDNDSLEYTGNRVLSVKTGGVSAHQIQTKTLIPSNFSSSTVFSSGGLFLNSVSGLSANVDNTTLFIVASSNTISIKPEGITSTYIANSGVDLGKISPTVLGEGLSGAGSRKIVAKVDYKTINFSAEGEIQVDTISANNIKLGTGMVADGANRLTHIIQTVDTSDLEISNSQLNLSRKFDFNTDTYFAPNLTINNKGVIIDATNGFMLPLSTNRAGYGGFTSQLSGEETNTLISVITGVSATNTQTISSAGFIILNIGTPEITTGDERGYSQSQYIAIPAFTIPNSIINLIDGKLTTADPYPFEWVGYRAYEPSSDSISLSGSILSSAACSGADDYKGISQPVIIYSNTYSLSVGTYFAATPTSLTSSNYNSLSGWINIEGEFLYLVDSNNIIVSISSCP